MPKSKEPTTIYVTVKAKGSLIELYNKVAISANPDKSFDEAAQEFLTDIAQEKNCKASLFEYEIFILNANKFYKLTFDKNLLEAQ